MQTLPTIPTRKVSSHPSPVAIWQRLLTYLLERHYGLSLNDTQFGDDIVIQEHIEAGITLVDAVNFMSWFVSTAGRLAGWNHLHTCEL